MVLSLIISSCSTSSQEIDQLEEQIVALENKENLTPKEEAELNQLIEKQEELIENDEPVNEEKNNFYGFISYHFILFNFKPRN